MKISSFNKSNLKSFREEFAKAVKDLEDKMGVKIDLGNFGYSADQFTTKTTVTVVSEGENPEEVKMKKTLKDYGWRYDLTEKDYGKTIHFHGETATLIGIAPKSHKYPILAKKGDKTFKYPVGILGK